MSSNFPVRLLSTMALGLGLAVAPMALAQAASHVKSPILQGYKTEAEAKTGCAGDAIVWRASGSKVFHLAGSKYFGKTKRGTFVCEKAAEAKGLHAAKS